MFGILFVSQLNDIPIPEALLFYFPILDTCDLTYNINCRLNFFIASSNLSYGGTAAMPGNSLRSFAKFPHNLLDIAQIYSII